MDSIHNVIVGTEANGVDGPIRGKNLEELIIVERVVEVNLASLFPTDLRVHDAPTSIEADFLCMRY